MAVGGLFLRANNYSIQGKLHHMLAGKLMSKYWGYIIQRALIVLVELFYIDYSHWNVTFPLYG